MSRAVRRQQQNAQKEAAPAKVGSTRMRAPRPTRGIRPAATQRRLRLGVPAWVQDIWSELGKVTWPTREETIYLTTVVIIVSLTVGVILGGVDIFFNWLIDRLLLR